MKTKYQGTTHVLAHMPYTSKSKAGIKYTKHRRVILPVSFFANLKAKAKNKLEVKRK